MIQILQKEINLNSLIKDILLQTINKLVLKLKYEGTHLRDPIGTIRNSFMMIQI